MLSHDIWLDGSTWVMQCDHVAFPQQWYLIPWVMRGDWVNVPIHWWTLIFGQWCLHDVLGGIGKTSLWRWYTIRWPWNIPTFPQHVLERWLGLTLLKGLATPCRMSKPNLVDNMSNVGHQIWRFGWERRWHHHKTKIFIMGEIGVSRWHMWTTTSEEKKDGLVKRSLEKGATSQRIKISSQPR